MKMYRVLFSLMVMVILVSGLACGSSKNGDDDLAPDSVAGKSYQITVASGTGVFATTGAATLTLNTDGTYATVGDGLNTGDDNGAYTQTKLSSDTVQFVLNSALYPQFQGGAYIFTYTSSKTGPFTASLPSGDTQSGTFQEL